MITRLALKARRITVGKSPEGKQRRPMPSEISILSSFTLGSVFVSGFRYRPTMIDRNLIHGLIRLHILHHAAEGPIFGQAMIDELGRHGYRLSAGTLYPILHGMERQGYLRSPPRH